MEVDQELTAPLCEASAILMLSDHTWLVADNEIHDRLFGLSRRFGEFGDPEAFPMPDGNRPRDIEALAQIDEREFLVVGSHSDRRDGTFSRKRHRLRWLRFVSHRQGAEETHFADASARQWRGGTSECQQALFTNPDEAQARFCDALTAANEMDIEGAAVVDGRVWLGFRAPLVDGHAVMARLAGRELRFDALRMLDLGGHGIRAMDDFEGALFVVAGPTGDVEEEHVLYQVQEQTVTRLATLPPYTEGLAIHSAGRALFVTDGAAGEPTCAAPSRLGAIEFSVVDE